MRLNGVLAFRSRNLFEHWSEYREIGAFIGRLGNVGHGMTGNPNDSGLLFAAHSAPCPHCANITRRNILRAQMHAIGVRGKSDIGSRVDKQPSRQLPVFGSQSSNDRHCRMSQRSELTGGKIFFAQLDEIQSATRRLGDLLQQSALAGTLVAGKLGTIRDVVEKQFCLGIGLRNFRHGMAFVLRFRTEVILGQTVAQKLKTLFRRVYDLE